MEQNYRFTVWRHDPAKSPPDPETYWCSRDEVVQLLDDVLYHNQKQPQLAPVICAEVTVLEYRVP